MISGCGEPTSSRRSSRRSMPSAALVSSVNENEFGWKLDPSRSAFEVKVSPKKKTIRSQARNPPRRGLEPVDAPLRGPHEVLGGQRRGELEVVHHRPQLRQSLQQLLEHRLLDVVLEALVLVTAALPAERAPPREVVVAHEGDD